LWERDEYPFASTKEGGTGAQVMCMPGWENRIQSGDLPDFYGNELLAGGDPFYVFTVPY
jgi:deoxyribonuclease NucA/NucB